MNSTKFYNSNIAGFAVGSSVVTKIYLGSNLIYEQAVEPTNISLSGGTIENDA